MTQWCHRPLVARSPQFLEKADAQEVDARRRHTGRTVPEANVGRSADFRMSDGRPIGQ